VAMPACGRPCTAQPVFTSAILGARPNAYKGDGGAGWETGQNEATTWKPPWVAGLEGRKTGVGGRLGEAGAGVGAATLVRRWCWRLIPVRERANACAAACVRQCAPARWLPVGVGAGRDEASRRCSRRSPARRHGQRRARRPRSVRASARGFTAVTRCVQGDQGHGVLFPPPPATVHEVLGHGEATAAWCGQARRRRTTREGRAKAQPGLPGIDTCACWGAR
jgi:hypothetical protein